MELLKSVVTLQQQLKQAGVTSAVIGGIAVSVWGEPRLTRDVDLKVLLRREDAARLLEILSPEYVCLSSNPLATLRRNGLLFVQDSLNTRLDLLLTDTDFDVQAIQRARPIEIQPGIVATICTAEDLVIYKLISTRPRDNADAESVVHRQGDNLDDAYVLGWLRQFEEAVADSTLVAEYLRLRGKRPAVTKRRKKNG